MPQLLEKERVYNKKQLNEELKQYEKVLREGLNILLEVIKKKVCRGQV